MALSAAVSFLHSKGAAKTFYVQNTSVSGETGGELVSLAPMYPYALRATPHGGAAPKGPLVGLHAFQMTWFACVAAHSSSKPITTSSRKRHAT